MFLDTLLDNLLNAIDKIKYNLGIHQIFLKEKPKFNRKYELSTCETGIS